MTFDRYQMNDMGDGRFGVMEMRPTTLGVFFSQSLAERFVDYLNQIDPDLGHSGGDNENVAVIEDDEGADADEPVRMGVPGFDHPIDFGEPGTVAAPEAAVQKADAAAPESETPMQEAFRRLSDGDELVVVAADIGITMPKLRGRWAAEMKKRKAAGAAEGEAESTAAPAPVAAMGEQTECRLCGRVHKATLASDGLCARCSKNTGGL